MNNSAILHSCRFISLAVARSDKFGLSQTETLAMFAIRALDGAATYDAIAQTMGISTHTLRSTSTSPLSKLGDKGLVEDDLKRNWNSKVVRVFHLTEQGEIVLHFLLTGTNREEVT